MKRKSTQKNTPQFPRRSRRKLLFPIIGLLSFLVLSIFFSSTPIASYLFMNAFWYRRDAKVPLTQGGSAIGAALGSSTSCLMMGTGKVHCAGSNNQGQAGNSSSTVVGDDEIMTSSTAAGLSGNAIQISGLGNTFVALLGNGTIECWGDNTNGTCGQGNASVIGDNESPASVTLGEDALSVDAGLYHVCAVLEDGQAKCWGDNSQGQLGDGD